MRSRHQRNVAIKVATANRSDETSRELYVLRALRDRGDPNHPGQKHVLHLLDSFYVRGPNGRHICLVLNVLGSSVHSIADTSQNCRLDGNLAHSLSRQLLQAVDYLHSAGVAHGGEFLSRHPVRPHRLNSRETYTREISCSDTPS